MFKPLIDIIGYLKMFQHYLGNKIYIIFILGIISAFFEGIGILMLLPLLENLDSSGITEIDKNDNITLITSKIIEFVGVESSVTGILLFITFAFIIKGLITFSSLGFSAFLKGKLLYSLKSRLFYNYQNMSYAYYSSNDTGHFTNLINEQPTKALESFNQITIFGSQIVNATVLMTLAFLSTWLFGLMAMFVGIILLIIFLTLNSYVRKLSRITASENGILTKWLIQTLHGFKYLKSTIQIKLLKNNILKSIEILTNNQIKTGIAAGFTQSLREPIAVVFIMCVVFFQILILDQRLEPILVSIVLFYRALNAVLAVQSSFQGTFQHIGSMELVNKEFLTLKKNYEKTGEKIIENFSSSIKFESVNFSYTDSKENTIKDLSFQILNKTSVAFVGESGSGKSTIIDLITLMLENQSGNIFIDNLNSKKICKESWRSQIGYVSQDAVMFDDTIGNNICMWQGDYNNDGKLRNKIIEASKKANIYDFISEQPEGLNTHIGDRGLLISGGQKQRLFIARELFRNPKLLILDEATSALDSASEKIVQQSIDSLKGKITTIIIAHRLSTIRNVDSIFVIDNGKLIEQGTYDSLKTNKKSKFRKLIELQSL